MASVRSAVTGDLSLSYGCGWTDGHIFSPLKHHGTSPSPSSPSPLPSLSSRVALPDGRIQIVTYTANKVKPDGIHII